MADAFDSDPLFSTTKVSLWQVEKYTPQQRRTGVCYNAHKSWKTTRSLVASGGQPLLIEDLARSARLYLGYAHGQDFTTCLSITRQDSILRVTYCLRKRTSAFSLCVTIGGLLLFGLLGWVTASYFPCVSRLAPQAPVAVGSKRVTRQRRATLALLAQH